MADAQDITDLSDLIFRISQDRVKNQASFVQKTVAIKLPMEEDYEVPPAEERRARPVALLDPLGEIRAPPRGAVEQHDGL